MLSDRRRRVLNALIEEYISTAAPVSSKAIVGRHDLGVSSATVRNELYVLEEDGYVVSPHVSSGRIPTDTGYRTFVDELLENAGKRAAEGSEAGDKDPAAGASEGVEPATDGGDSAEPSDDITDDLRESATELDELLRQTSKALNRFTDCLAVVMAPRVTRIALKQIALVKMDSRHVIVVIAIRDGRVLNRVVELADDHPAEEIRALEMMLNQLFEVKGSFDPLAGEAASPVAGISMGALTDTAAKQELERLVAGIEECLVEEERDRLHLSGIEDLFSQPELQRMSLTMGFARLLDDDLMMFRLLGDFLASRDVSVRIGHEHADESFSDISVVASGYGPDDQQGMVAIVGPTRMNYEKVIKAVRHASGFLDDTLKNRE